MKQRLYKVESIMSVTVCPGIQYHITINIEKIYSFSKGTLQSRKKRRLRFRPRFIEVRLTKYFSSLSLSRNPS